MGRAKSPAWTEAEIATLRRLYPDSGVPGVAAELRSRSWHAIHVMAHKQGLRTAHRGSGRRAVLVGEPLQRAIKLREEGWAFARIGAELGLCEMTVSNAVLIAMCPRMGYTPAQRDRNGHLAPEGIDRIRLMLRKGLKGVDIQLRLGVSAACVAEQRQRYAADLKARGKAPLPPAGNGLAYSGRKFTREKRREVEALFMQGLGAKKVSERTGVSNSQVGRIRNVLVKRLRRKGECLPGCDRDGQRRRQAESSRFITPTSIERLRALLMDGTPVRRAAAETGIGSKSSYRLRDELAAELKARGEALPPTRNWRDRGELREAKRATWLPEGQLYRFRALSLEIGEDAARAQIIAEDRERKRAEAARPLTFEEQLERVRNGAAIGPVIRFKPAIADITLGGVATGML